MRCEPARDVTVGLFAVRQAEVSEAQRMEEERLRAERRKAIREGKLPPVMKRSVLDIVQEEEAAHIAKGLRTVGQY